MATMHCEYTYTVIRDIEFTTHGKAITQRSEMHSSDVLLE